MIYRPTRLFPAVLFALALLWFAALTFLFRTHGAIGDDPATYVQMGRDLAERGTVVHDFPLFTKLYDKGLSWDAFITPGYHLVRETGVTAPNFAFGFPLLLAAVYRVFGEAAAYFVTPVMGLLALLATFGVANELARDLSRGKRYWIGALAVLLVATTPKQIQLALVPMSDVPAQLFCLLALWCALRAGPGERSVTAEQGAEMGDANRTSSHTSRWLMAALCGLSLGMAYLIRHSTLVMIIPLALVAPRWGRTRRERAGWVLVSALVLALAVLPDAVYRMNVLGSLFAVESPESARMVWLDAPRQFVLMLAALFSATGFGPLVLLAPLGWWILVREKQGWVAAVLAGWVFAFVFLHAPLQLTGVFENNLRYLIPAYPAIAFSIGFFLVWFAEFVWRRAANARSRVRTANLVYYAAPLLMLVAFGVAVRALAGPERFVARAYGWMGETARRDFDALALSLPRDAVIGVSDQMAGATLLYTGRDIFRPANFLDPSQEFPRFLQAMRQESRAVFLLGDWNCSPAAQANERLPLWVENYPWRQTALTISELPYECPQHIYQLDGE